MYFQDAKNSFATSDWRADIKTQWPANPASFPKAKHVRYVVNVSGTSWSALQAAAPGVALTKMQPPPGHTKTQHLFLSS